jgi:ribosomal protein S8
MLKELEGYIEHFQKENKHLESIAMKISMKYGITKDKVEKEMKRVVKENEEEIEPLI